MFAYQVRAYGKSPVGIHLHDIQHSVPVFLHWALLQRINPECTFSKCIRRKVMSRWSIAHLIRDAPSTSSWSTIITSWCHAWFTSIKFRTQHRTAWFFSHKIICWICSQLETEKIAESSCLYDKYLSWLMGIFLIPTGQWPANWMACSRTEWIDNSSWFFSRAPIC